MQRLSSAASERPQKNRRTYCYDNFHSRCLRLGPGPDPADSEAGPKTLGEPESLLYGNPEACHNKIRAVGVILSEAVDVAPVRSCDHRIRPGWQRLGSQQPAIIEAAVEYALH